MRVTRHVLEMSDRELAAVIAVAMPGRKIEGLRRDERHEICMKWLFANGLSINHKFTLDIEDQDDIYVLMSNKNACKCCPKDGGDTVSIRSFDNSAIGNSLVAFHKNGNGGGEVRIGTGERDTPSNGNRLTIPPITGKASSDNSSTSSSVGSISDRRGQKIQPICTQPKPMPPPQQRKNEKKEEPAPDESCCRTFWREYGTCCVGLWSNC